MRLFSIILVLSFLFPAHNSLPQPSMDHEKTACLAFTATQLDRDTPMTNIQDIATGDFDHDGDIDFAVTSIDNGMGLSWWENDGDGYPFTKHDIATSLQGMVVHVEDFNEDGWLDILGTDRYDGYSRLYLNQKNKTFSSTGTSLPAHTLGAMWDFDTADFDGDGDIDIAFANHSIGDYTTVGWWLNDGNETFTKHFIQSPGNYYYQPNHIEAVDIDADGDMDLLTSQTSNGDDLVWWKNDGSGNYTRTTLIDGTHSFVLADLDNDGDKDIVSNGKIYYNNGYGSFYTVDTSISSAVTTSDLNNDGFLDLIRQGTTFAWYEYDENLYSYTYNFIANYDYPGAIAIAAADLTGDGRDEIIGTANGKLYEWYATISSPSCYSPKIETIQIDQSALATPKTDATRTVELQAKVTHPLGASNIDFVSATTYSLESDAPIVPLYQDKCLNPEPDVYCGVIQTDFPVTTGDKEIDVFAYDIDGDYARNSIDVKVIKPIVDLLTELSEDRDAMIGQEYWVEVMAVEEFDPALPDAFHAAGYLYEFFEIVRHIDNATKFHPGLLIAEFAVEQAVEGFTQTQLLAGINADELIYPLMVNWVPYGSGQFIDLGVPYFAKVRVEESMLPGANFAYLHILEAQKNTPSSSNNYYVIPENYEYEDLQELYLNSSDGDKKCTVGLVTERFTLDWTDTPFIRIQRSVDYQRELILRVPNSPNIPNVGSLVMGCGEFNDFGQVIYLGITKGLDLTLNEESFLMPLIMESKSQVRDREFAFDPRIVIQAQDFSDLMVTEPISGFTVGPVYDGNGNLIEFKEQLNNVNIAYNPDGWDYGIIIPPVDASYMIELYGTPEEALSDKKATTAMYIQVKQRSGQITSEFLLENLTVQDNLIIRRTLNEDHILSRPQHLEIETISGNLQLTWDANPEDYIEGYYIYQAQNYNGPYYRLNSDLITANQFMLPTLEQNEPFFYKITAFGNYKESAYSDTVKTGSWVYLPAIIR